MNYKHLLYFWTVARLGGVVKAGEHLHVTPQTISGQIQLLEEQIGRPLFRKKGRKLEMTETGQLAFSYAQDIFNLGAELEQVVRQPQGALRPVELRVGNADAVPKLVVYRLLKPVLALPNQVRLVCREDNMERLIAQLGTYLLDVVIATAPAPGYLPVKVYNRLLGESDISIFAPAPLATRLRRRFPASLQDAPMLLPTTNAPLRRALDEWFETQGVRPRVVGEFEDSALMKVFGQSAGCLFPAPSAIAADVNRFHSVKLVGRAETVRERYYVISAERRLTHPGILAMTSAARDEVFRSDT